MKEGNKGAPRTVSTLQLSASDLASAVGRRMRQRDSSSGRECLMARLARLSSYKLVEEGFMRRKREGGKSSFHFLESFDFGGADYL